MNAYLSSVIDTVHSIFTHYVAESLQDSQLAHSKYRVPKWVWISCSVLGLAVCFKLHYDKTYGVWKRQGVPGPKPLPFVGTSYLMALEDDFASMNRKMMAKYGQKGYYG